MVQIASHPEALRLFGLGIEELAIRILAPPTEVPLTEWAEANRVLPDTGLYRLTRVPWLRPIMEAFCDPNVREIVVLKGARLGMTEGLINTVIGYIIDQLSGSILVVWPTKEDAQEWSKETLPDLFENTLCLRGKVKDAGERDSNNTILHKRHPTGWLTAVGSNSSRTLRRRTARFVFIDEYDACDTGTTKSKEGDIGARAARRADTIADAKILKTGSPVSFPSRIHRDFLDSDQGEYELPCPHCKQYQVFTWQHVQWDKEKDRKDRVERHKTETAHFTCMRCGAVIDESEKPWMLERLKVVPRNPGHKTRGFKVPTLLSLFPQATLEVLADQWVKAQTDRELLREFMQQVLAEPFEDRGEVPDTDALLDRQETYNAEVPAGACILTAAIDVQDDRIELLIKAWGVGQESWDIEHHRLYGDPTAEDQAVWKSADRLLFRRFQHELGAQLTVRATVVDMGDGDHTDAVQRYCQARRRLNVYAVKGEQGKKGKPTVIRPGKAKGARRHFMIADDRLKRIVFRRLRYDKPGPGFIHFPIASGNGHDAEYFKQFKNEFEKPEPQKDGTMRFKWVQTGANEAPDLQKMCLAALHILGDPVMNYLPQLVARVRQEGEARGGPTAVKASKVPLADRPIAPIAPPRARRRGMIHPGTRL